MTSRIPGHSEKLDDEKVTQFFNDLELKEDEGDLQLLLEAEKRNLLNPVCQQILKEARRRGWVQPKEGSEERLEVYQVKYLGATKINNNVESGDEIVTRHVSEAVSRITKNPRAAFQSHLLLEVHANFLRLFDVDKKGIETSGTMNRLKKLTLRKILGKRPSVEKDITGIKTDENQMIAEHERKNIINFLSFGKIVAVVMKETDYTDKLVFNCYAYKLKNQNEAFEVADHLRVTHDGILKRNEHRRKMMHPIERVTLSSPHGNGEYGINLIGPSTRVEAAIGVFILSLDKGSVSSSHPNLKEGLQIMAVNGINTEDVTIAECREQIRASKHSVVLDVQDNPYGFGLHQYEQGVRKPSVSYHLDVPSLNESRVDGLTLPDMANRKHESSTSASLSSSIANDHISSKDHHAFNLDDITLQSEDEEEDDDEEEEENNNNANCNSNEVENNRGFVNKRVNNNKADNERKKRLSMQVDDITKGLLDLSSDPSYTVQVGTTQMSSW